jgi:hypothetical protein
MAHRAFDEQMEALESLSGHPLDPASIALIRKSLANRSNFLVAKAARLAEDNSLADLVPDLITAFERFFTNAEKTDPQCWAKNALSRALMKLDHRDKEVYLRGLHHHQMEPVWGGRSDSAGTLRANCAHALVACEGLANDDLLLLLLDLLVDADKSVRAETVRAMAQIGETAIPVLRLRALIPGEDPEVLSTCFRALLAIDPAASVSFVASFLEQADDVAAEAAFSLAETHRPEVLQAFTHLHQNPARGAGDPWFAGILLTAMALTRLPAAIEYLISLIEREDREAPIAIEALAKIASNSGIRERLIRTVEDVGSPRLTKALHDHLLSNPA